MKKAEPVASTPRLEKDPIYDFWCDMFDGLWCGDWIDEEWDLEKATFIELVFYKARPHENAIRLRFRREMDGVRPEKLIGVGRDWWEPSFLLGHFLDDLCKQEVGDHIFYIEALDCTDWWKNR